MYWAVGSKDVKLGETSMISAKPQQLILDNGMSFAMAPMPSFTQLVNTLFTDHGVACFEH